MGGPWYIFKSMVDCLVLAVTSATDKVSDPQNLAL